MLPQSPVRQDTCRCHLPLLLPALGILLARQLVERLARSSFSAPCKRSPCSAHCTDRSKLWPRCESRNCWLTPASLPIPLSGGSFAIAGHFTTAGFVYVGRRRAAHRRAAARMAVPAQDVTAILNLDRMHGLARPMPRFAAVFSLFVMAAVGLPSVRPFFRPDGNVAPASL